MGVPPEASVEHKGTQVCRLGSAFGSSGLGGEERCKQCETADPTAPWDATAWVVNQGGHLCRGGWSLGEGRQRPGGGALGMVTIWQQNRA